MSHATASDGHRARLCGSWTREKLRYLEKYAQAFMVAMAPKRDEGKWGRLIFIDLLAGPGLDKDRDTGAEFRGSALIALRTAPKFDRLYLGDKSKANVAALRARVPKQDLDSRVDLKPGDCNARVAEVAGTLSHRTLGLAFVDPEGFEVEFRMLEALASRRIDVLMLFPSGIGIARNLARFARHSGDTKMDRMWGDRSWRDLPIARAWAGRKVEPHEIDAMLDHSWVREFRKRVRSIGLVQQDDEDPVLRNERNVPMYHLLFFAKDSAALTIWRGIKRIDAQGQRSLRFDDQ